jgi:hypothetical protein
MTNVFHAAALAAILLGICSTAQAAETGPLVLNGQLATSDFSGGVGDREGASGDIYTTNYFVMRGNGGRGRGFGFPHSGGHGMGHGGSHGGDGHR